MIFFFLFCAFQSTMAQTRKDTLLDVWNNLSAADTVRIKAGLGYLKKHLRSLEADSAKIMVNQVLILTQTNPTTIYETEALRLRANVHYILHDYQEAIRDFKKSKSVAERVNYPKGIAYAFNGLGNVYNNLMKLDSAQFCHEQALQLSVMNNDSQQMSKSYHNIGLSEVKRGNLEKGLEWYSKSQKLRIQLALWAELAHGYNGIAVIYQKKNDYSAAYNYYNKALELNKRENSQRGIAYNYINMGALFVNMHNYEQAEVHFCKARELFDSLQMTNYVNYCNSNLAIVQRSKGSLENNVDAHIKDLDRYTIEENPTMHNWTLRQIAQAYYAIGEYRSAIQYFKKALKGEALMDPSNSALVKCNIGYSYQFLGDLDSATLWYQVSYPLAKKQSDYRTLAKLNEGFGYVAYKQKNYLLADSFTHRAMDWVEEQDLKSTLVSLLNMSAFGQLEQGNINKAKRLADRSLEIANQSKSLKAMRAAQNAQYRVHKQANNHRLALQAYEKFIQYRDSLTQLKDVAENVKSGLTYEFTQQQLRDSLNFVQQQAKSDLEYQQQIHRRNTLFFTVFGAGLLGFLLLYYRNKTRIRKDQEQLQLEKDKAKYLEELEQAKSNFYMNVTHEFRSPLTIILGMTDKLKEDLKINKIAAAQRVIELVEANGRRLLQLVSQLMDLGKLESDAYATHTVQSDIVFFIDYIIESYHSLAASKDIQLSDQHDQPSFLMDFDEDIIQKIVTNLISNSIKFSEPGGHITLNTSVVNDRFQIKITDDGKGIGDEEKEKIFTRFYQGDHIVSQGAGIGLTLVHELVSLMNGEIQVESKLGKGSVFRVLLPITHNAPFQDLTPNVQSAVEVNMPTQTVMGQALDKENILIIEDNNDVAYFIGQCLKNYQVDFASNGKIGLEIARASLPDFIICDVMMPEMGGFEVTKQLKEDFRTSHIPIILLTARADQKSKIQGLQQGADGYLTKPFDKKELLIRIEQLLQLRANLRSRYADLNFLQDRKSLGDKHEFNFLVEIKDYVLLNRSEDITVEGLCKAIGMSRSQMHRKLKALTDQSTTEFIRSIRIRQAQDLLRTTSLTISEVAYDCGFKTPSYFSKVFTKQTGKSPTDYRASHASSD